jgi:hypothetical protein
MPLTPDPHIDGKLDLVAETLRSNGTIQLKAWGASMLPSLWPGDLLTIQAAKRHEFAAGDIALILRDNRFFIHRLFAMRKTENRFEWITRGDAMPQSDPPVALSELLGRVIRIRRGNRNLVPSPRVSIFDSLLAWMLCRSDQVRNLALHIHSMRRELGGAGQAVRGVADFVRTTFDIPRFDESSR